MYVKFDFNALCKKVLDEKLKEHGLKYRLLNFGEVEFYEPLHKNSTIFLRKIFEDYGIEIIESQKKCTGTENKRCYCRARVFSDEIIPVKASIYISEKLNHSYGYLSNLFQKLLLPLLRILLFCKRLSMQKALIIRNKQSLTEIAHKLNYSSVAHLSTQFKKYNRNHSIPVSKNYWQTKKSTKHCNKP